MDNRATTSVGYCPTTASFSVRPHCKNARQDRCQEYHNCFPFGLGELEKTTRTSSNYVDEDYPANNLSLDEAITVAQNRPLWRLMSAFGMPHKKKKKKNSVLNYRPLSFSNDDLFVCLSKYTR